MMLSFYRSAIPYSVWSHQLSGSSHAAPQCRYYITIGCDPFKFSISDLCCGKCLLHIESIMNDLDVRQRLFVVERLSLI
jgi:hypothetical protein